MKKTSLFTLSNYRLKALSAAIFGVLTLPHTALAQMEEIVVTAAKRAQTLQDIPIAVSVTSQQTIEEAAIVDLSDLQSVVPALRVTALQASTNATFSIRGFGNGANNTGIEPSVGVFIDGVYRSRAGAQIGDLPRVERIEVLRGPQSTLFGKNASAGVISIVTAEPSFETEGKIEAGIGNFNKQQMKGYITGAVSDKVALSLSGGFNSRDGYGKSLTGQSKVNERDRWNIRSQALFEGDNLTLRVIADYSEIDEVCCTVASGVNGAAAGAIAALGGTLMDANDPFSYETAFTKDPENEVEDGGISVQADIDFEDFSFTSITSYRKNTSYRSYDSDFTGLDILEASTLDTDIETFTQEFRLTSTSGGDLDWMVGGFYFSEEIEEENGVLFGVDARNYFDILAGGPAALATLEMFTGNPAGTFFGPDTAVIENFTQENDAFSLFGTIDYHINDSLTATLGLSYTDDKKDVSATQNNNDALSALDLTSFAGGAFAGLKGLQFLPPLLEFPNVVEDGSSSDDATTWQARLAYEMNESINFYVSAATGYKASSWNMTRDSKPFLEDQAALTDAGLLRVNQTYGTRLAGPEDSTVYELGMKIKTDYTAVNIAVFEQTIEGFQSSIFQGTGFVLANAGEQSTTGIEIDALYAPNESWEFNVAGIFLDPVYDDFENASGINGTVIDLTGTKPAGVHEESISASATYKLDFDNGINGFIRADYLYESDTTLVSNVPTDLRREVSTFNASAGLTFPNGVQASLWAKNINNDEFFLSAFPGVAQPGNFYVYPNQPRTVGANVSYQF